MISIWKKTGIISTVIIVLMIPLSLLIHKRDSHLNSESAKFVGGKECISCHKPEYDLWKNSNHDNAMSTASDSTVLGDFNNVEVVLNGINHKFYRRDGKFYVYTKGPGGILTEYEIAYTFGVKPLQQYLVPFEKGRFQCLPIAWDTNRKKWFDMAGMVYPAEDLKPDSWFYWTNQSQNWNGMCAECHSTNLQKNYNLEQDSFNTTWTDIDVNCEACHGPGSEHLEWAKLPEGARDNDGNKGLILKTSSTTSKQYIEGCAPCHSRRTSFAPNVHNDPEYYNNHRPQNISPPLYYSDGQILDEDYEFASFTQSKMYMNDVKCSDCHDSHSLKFKFEGNLLCTQCHRAEEFDTFQHHFHKYKNEAGSPVKNKFGETIPVGDGTLCINCHMPGKYYMGIDYRRDHSIRIPRPDISIRYNSPNACNDCHADKSFQWSEDYIKKYYGENKKPAYGIALSNGYLRKEGADTELIKIIKSELYPEIVRASAITYLSAYNNENVYKVIREMLNNPEPIIRERAVDLFSSTSARELVKFVSPLLSDPVKMVRIAAANRLSDLARENFSEDQYKTFIKVQEEYFNAIMYTADFPSGKYNLANYYFRKQELEIAEKFYTEAIKGDGDFYPAKSNLALLYYSRGRFGEAEKLYLDLIRYNKEYTDGYYQLGLLYAEQKKYKEAALYLEQASLTANANPRIYYNLGILYQYLNDWDRAQKSLQKAYSLLPDDFDIIYALADYNVKREDYDIAMKYAGELKAKFPSNPAGEQLIEYINERLNFSQ